MCTIAIKKIHGSRNNKKNKNPLTLYMLASVLNIVLQHYFCSELNNGYCLGKTINNLSKYTIIIVGQLFQKFCLQFPRSFSLICEDGDSSLGIG